jgi:hypothetical protein
MLSIAGVAGAGDAVDIYANCRDGEPSRGGNMPCDTDGESDGACTFGDCGGAAIKVPAGQSNVAKSACGTVAKLTCTPSASGGDAAAGGGDPAYIEGKASASTSKGGRSRPARPSGSKKVAPPKMAYPPEPR